MVTLTYRNGNDWQPKHVSALLDHIRHWCKAERIKCRYVWVAELQARGAIHYHLALWMPHGKQLPMPDSKGWWPHGYTRTERARAAVPYLLKYLSKGSGALRLPDGARMHGVGGLDHSMRRAARWLRMPGFVQSRADIFDDWRPARGGGWVGPDAVVWPSEFKRAWLGDAYGLLRVHQHGRPFRADGPFTWLHRRPQPPTVLHEPWSRSISSRRPSCSRYIPRPWRSSHGPAACRPARSGAPGCSSSLCSSTSL